MKMINQKNENQQIIYQYEAGGEEWKKAIENAKKNLAKTVKIEGFRPGKAPLEVAEKYLDFSKVFSNALNPIINKAIKDLESSKEFNENDQEVIDGSSVIINDVDNNKAVFDLIYDLYPTVEIDHYKNLDLPKFEDQVDDEEVQKDLNNLVKTNKTISKKSGKKADVLAKGDIAVFDFTGYKNGEQFAGGNAKNYELEIGSNQFIPGFEDQMIGLKLGEERNLDLSFPKDYPSKELAGEKVVFKVKLNDIKEVSISKLDDELVKKQGIKDVDTVEKFKNYSKQQLLAAKQQQFKEKITSEIVNKIIELTKYSHIPQRMVEAEKKTMLESYESQLKQQGLTLEKYLNVTNTDKNNFDKQILEQAQKAIILMLGIEAIAKQENLEISESDIMDYIVKMTKIYGGDPKQIREQVGENTERIEADLIQAKVFDIVGGLSEGVQKTVKAKQDKPQANTKNIKPKVEADSSKQSEKKTTPPKKKPQPKATTKKGSE